MNGPKKAWLALMVATAMVLGVAASAQADSLAQSTLQLTGFEFLNAAGTAAIDASAFAPGTLNITDSTNLNPSLNGVFNPFSTFTVGGAPIPLTVVCVPAGCPAGLNPGAPFANATTPPTVSGALGASSLDGEPITGIGGTLGANARTAARAQLTSTGVANSSANLGLVAQFQFQPTASQAVRVDFNALMHLIAFLNTPGSANAGVAWSISITDITGGGNTLVFSWAPDGLPGGIFGTGALEISDPCNINTTRGLLSPGSATADCNGHYTALTPVLLSSELYSVSIAHQNRADVLLAPRVPEPATLSLLGLGLICVGFASRYRRSRKGV